jgi:hypothetical protein
MTVTRRNIPEHPSSEGGRLGRHVEHDERSRVFATAAPRGVRKHVLHGRHGKIYDQGNLGSCTGNAVTGAAITNPTYRSHHNYHEPMAIRVYKLATQIDGFPGVYPPDDTGSSGLAACKAAVQLGLIGSYQHAFSLDEALDALQERPVITGTDWLEGMDFPDGNGRVQLVGQTRGGHEYCAVEYDPGDGTPNGSWVRFANSWSAGWGESGYFWMRVSDWGTLLERDGDVTIPIR